MTTSVIETFGWAGALLLFSFGFIIWYATDEQKHSIIDLYVLGKGISNVWAIVVLSGVFVMTAIAQRRWYVGKLKILSNEVEREGKVKSKLQENKLNKQLQHAKSKADKGGK